MNRPNILRHSFSKTNEMHLFLKLFILVKNTLHVWEGLSVHHQELKTAHTAKGLCQTDTAIGDEMELQFHLIPDSSSCLT
jgi:hypothetical protein